MEIFGPEASGKTTLALHAIAEVQKAGGFACFVDAEHAFDASYAKVRMPVCLRHTQRLGFGIPELNLPAGQPLTWQQDHR